MGINCRTVRKFATYGKIENLKIDFDVHCCGDNFENLLWMCKSEVKNLKMAKNYSQK